MAARSRRNCGIWEIDSDSRPFGILAPWIASILSGSLTPRTPSPRAHELRPHELTGIATAARLRRDCGNWEIDSDSRPFTIFAPWIVINSFEISNGPRTPSPSAHELRPHELTNSVRIRTSERPMTKRPGAFAPGRFHITLPTAYSPSATAAATGIDSGVVAGGSRYDALASYGFSGAGGGSIPSISTSL